MVARTCGVSEEAFLEVCEAWAQNSGREKTTALVYSVGWTQHSVGVQYIRTGAILQLLLGNMGRPGGGIMALRGHASIQGSTDIPTLFNLLPGYLPMPNAADHQTLQQWVDSIRHPGSKGFWANADAFAVSLLKAYWGDAATAENDYCFDYLPKITGDHGTYRTVLDMIDGKVKGYFLLGQNPAVGLGPRQGAAARDGQPRLAGRPRPVRDRERDLLEELARDRDRRDRARGVPHRGVPAAGGLARGEGGHVHPDAADAAVAGEGARTGRATAAPSCGSSTTSAAWSGSGWRAPPTPKDRPVLDLAWDYPVHGRVRRPERGGRAQGDQRLRRRHAPAAVDVLRDEGRRLDRGRLLDLHRRLRGRRQPGGPAQARQGAVLGGPRVGLGVAANRRILYNRASADPDGKPWSERRPTSGGTRRPASGPGTTCPTSRRRSRRRTARPRAATASRRSPATTRSSCRATARAALYVPQGLIDGPHAHPLRAGRVAVPQPALRPAEQPDAQGVPARGQPDQPQPARGARRRLPVRVHHEPADRAPHGRRR